MAVRDNLLWLLRQAFVTEPSLFVFVRSHRSDLAHVWLAGSTHDRDELAELLVDTATREGEIGRLLDALLVVTPEFFVEIGEFRRSLLSNPSRTPGQDALPPHPYGEPPRSPGEHVPSWDPRARLLFRDSQGRERMVELSPTEIVYVGRGLECVVRTDDPMLSRRHSQIRMEDGRFVVEDLGSANGTFLNNTRVQKQALGHADVIRCGSLMIRFVDRAAVDQDAVNIVQQPLQQSLPWEEDAPPPNEDGTILVELEDVPGGFGSEPAADEPPTHAAGSSPYGEPPEPSNMDAPAGAPYGEPPEPSNMDAPASALYGEPPQMPSSLSIPPANNPATGFGTARGGFPGGGVAGAYGGPPAMPSPITDGSGSGGATRPGDSSSMFGSGGPMGPAASSSAPLAAPQFVHLGFAAPDAPGMPLIDRTLGAGEWYILWVEIQPYLIAGAAAGAATLVGLHDGDTLDVILFGFPRQFRLGPARHGRVQINAGGNQVVQLAWPETPAVLATRRLCFAVRTPWSFGRAALRCNIYHRGILLQSHLVSAEVTWFGRDRPHAVSRVCDYNLSASLDTNRLGPGTEHLLSILVNDDGHGTHSFRFVASKAGVPELIHDGHLDGTLLTEAVRYARKALQWVAWGAEEDWDSTRHTYRFTTPPDPSSMEDAYKILAVRGANLWGQIITQFGFLGPDARALRETMRRPGRVQIALKMSPDAVVPMAMVYDYPLDPARKNLALCEVSSAAIAAGKPLENEPCFLGDCPHYDDDHMVCVGGFWGFRHELGLPIHLPNGEIATTIARGEAVRGFAPISTDPNFVQRSAHMATLAALATDWLEVIDDRDTCIKRLVGEARPLIYFYCHGGLTKMRTPFLEVGAPGSDMITAQTLIDKFLHWSEPTRPLVILNGCHTTATSPEVMFSLLAALTWHANAAGVIGTEITNFEPIAVQVGADLVSRFLAGEEVGRAVKLARLGLLRQGNPLGLMYIPFALPSLHLV